MEAHGQSVGDWSGPISNECGEQLRLVGYEKSPPEPLECHMTSASHIIIVDGKVLIM